MPFNALCCLFGFTICLYTAIYLHVTGFPLAREDQSLRKSHGECMFTHFHARSSLCIFTLGFYKQLSMILIFNIIKITK